MLRTSLVRSLTSSALAASLCVVACAGKDKDKDGGSAAKGGEDSTSTGGSDESGGSTTSGGVGGTGGRSNSGGTSADGGQISSGGVSAGGAAGAIATGGTVNGGSATTGGKSGGGTASGGKASAGAATGGTASSTGGQGGSGGYLIPSPLISRGKPVESPQGTGKLAFDGKYEIESSWQSSDPPATGKLTNTWVKVNVGKGPTEVLLLWHHIATPDYVVDADINYGAPSDYTIEVSETGLDGSWQPRVEVVTPANQPSYRSRGHRFDFTGMSFIRMTVSRIQPQKAGAAHLQLSEIDVFDTSKSAEDTWVFAGSGPTRFAYDGHTSPMWPELVHKAHPGYYPAMIDIADLQGTSQYLLESLDDWLKVNPDFHFWVLTYGLGDAQGGLTPTQRNFKQNMQAVIDKLKAAGKVPIIPRAQKTYDTDHSHIPEFNTIIDQLVATNGLPKAPDFFDWFTQHRDQLCSTGCEGPTDVGVEPLDPTGYDSMNTLWAQTLDPLYAP